MEFEKRKAATLASINSPEPDKSPKGNIDTPIIPLLNALNSHPSYFTTSSCSGRISVLSQPTTAAAATTNFKKKAKGGTWVFISHDPTNPDTVLNLLFPTEPSSHPIDTQGLHSNLVFRFEPLIIAVECKDVASAQSLVSFSISCGFRESGITSVNKRVIVALRCSIRLEVPLGDTHKLMVCSEYVRYLVEIANEKMEANRRRTDKFLAALLGNGFHGPGNNVESNGECGEMDGDVGNNDAPPSSNSVEEIKNAEERNSDDKQGSLGSLSTARIVLIGEPVERLYLWGHSACTLDNKEPKKILIFGGFGGMGRHARRSDLFLLDPVSGTLEALNVRDTPCPRLGHTSSIVGDSIFVIGGRGDPLNILNDVWAFNTVKNEWMLFQCTGIEFPPRHRHAAAVIGSKVYVFGGIHNDAISSSLYVLDVHDMEWSEISIKGEWPCPRHSHSLVANGFQIYMFGGYDGERALGDFYSFDVKKCQWKKENMTERGPYARFSHSMFVYENYIGIIGGCPVGQSYQELSLLDLQSCLWKHIMMNSIGEDLLVRSTANVVGDELIIIGGGAACYAFGTKFSEPIKINLLPLMSFVDMSIPSKIREKHQEKVAIEITDGFLPCPDKKSEQISEGGPDLSLEIKSLGIDAGHNTGSSPSVLQLERKHAKFGKDILKRFGWLDLERKVYSGENGLYICFPVKENFCIVYNDKQHHFGDAVENLSDTKPSNSVGVEGLILEDITSFTALNLLMACGATKLADKVVKARKAPNSPLKVMKEAVSSLINRHGLPSELVEQIPTRWERLGDMIVLPASSFKDPGWESIGLELWPIIAEALGTRRLARQGRVAPTGTRDSRLEILVGDNGWVSHCENGIIYSFDSTKCMFSWGNLSEKLRMGRMDCRDEIIVDLFAGIGYFVLPFLVRANAKLVYACEWNPHAIEALRHNLHANSVADRCFIIEGDNRISAPEGVADRVCLGLLPTSEDSWVTAVRALRSTGGTLHVHDNVKDLEEVSWTKHVSKSINEIASSQGSRWVVTVEHVERVKWYAPHIRHLVADVRCKQIER